MTHGASSDRLNLKSSTEEFRMNTKLQSRLPNYSYYHRTF
ncbi:hypothetical protein BSU04_20460 [Caballeronia sordidicola]|uniref:Uncharacterized protein n=1 Tax=Caballeronia sordidicola TaxID=196367 RepID=A0A226WZX4_CABSO|nr:hypothetical protein BSU04_20460 [Caballeronia sordidicola]